MTTYTPDQLREIDAAVAEHVFGWVWMERYKSSDPTKARKAIYPPENDPYGWERCNFFESGFRPANHDTLRFKDWDRACLKNGPGFREYKSEMPRYSADVAAAWEVVEKMRDGGRKVSIETCHAGGRLHNDVVISATCDDLKAFGEADEETMPLSVCLAALKAVGKPWGEDAK